MDISNKTLALVLLVAVVVSLGGTFISLDRLDTFSSLTGFATANDNGTVTISITENATITFNPATVDFGPGQVATAGTCYLSTNGSNTPACLGFSQPAAPFTIINLGNENVSLQLIANASGPTFLGDVGGVLDIWITENATSPGCDSLNATLAGGWFEAPVTDSYICGGAAAYRFGVGSGKNAIDLHVNITMPDTTPSGGKAVKFTATGTSSSG